MNRVVFSSESDEWGTPQHVFDALNDEFRFTLDPCSTDDNAKCEAHFTAQDDGLSKSWTGETVFCNPPYSNVKQWVEKCYTESRKKCTTVVALLPSRTDTRWFHEYVYGKAEIRFIKGRLKFSGGAVQCSFSVNDCCLQMR